MDAASLPYHVCLGVPGSLEAELECIVLHFLAAASARDWANPVIMRHVSPSLRSHIQMMGKAMYSLTAFVEFMDQVIRREGYILEPLSIAASLCEDGDPDVVQPGVLTARVWALHQSTGFTTGIRRESVSLFDLEQGESGLWAIVYYNALRCMPAYVHEEPWPSNPPTPLVSSPPEHEPSKVGNLKLASCLPVHHCAGALDLVHAECDCAT